MDYRKEIDNIKKDLEFIIQHSNAYALDAKRILNFMDTLGSDLYTERSLKEIKNEIFLLDLPQQDIIDQAKEIILAFSRLNRYGKTTQKQQQIILKTLAQLKNSSKEESLFADAGNGIDYLNRAWVNAKLPDINSAIQSTSELNNVKFPKITESNISTLGINLSTIPEKYHSYIITDINFLQQFSNKVVKFYSPNNVGSKSSNLSNYNQTQSDLIKHYLNALQEMTKMVPILQ